MNSAYPVPSLFPLAAPSNRSDGRRTAAIAFVLASLPALVFGGDRLTTLAALRDIVASAFDRR